MTNVAVSAEMVEADVVDIMEGEVWRREEVVEAVLGNSAGVAVLVVEGKPSTAMAFVVTVAVVLVLETVVLSETPESETSAEVVEVIVIVGGTVDD